ncbi:hypothetical protein H4V99_001305 [Cryobacterium sp. CG_9.6]|nr:hypothetical protein [Cryobacterium sp. CG_9.6]
MSWEAPGQQGETLELERCTSGEVPVDRSLIDAVTR